jgi:hypothetical protein
MKKLFLFAILLTSFSHIFAFTTQGNWRWRNDDGSETTATWIAAQNTDAAITSASDPIRLRVELYNASGGLLDDAIFEDSTAGGTWDTIKLAADADDAFVLAGTSPNVTDLEATTQQLASPHNATYVAGKIIVSSEKLPAFTVGSSSGTEYEYVIKPTANLLPSTTYYFRVDAANWPDPLPSLTTAAVLPVSLLDFTLKKDGKKVRLDWSTASEQNNDRFEIEKSNDGRAWSTIATIKANGTSNEIHHYNAYDEAPFNGVNYYRLKQFDLDGHSKVSAIKSLKFVTQLNLVTISPNPSRGVINFKLENISATNVSVSLTNTNGKLIYREIMNTVDAGKAYKLNLLQQPAPGMYILNLQAEGLKESIKVVIQ